MKIKEEWKWAAKDASGEWWLYSEKPEMCGNEYRGLCRRSPLHHEDLPWDKSLCILKDNEYVLYVDVPEDGEQVIVILEDRERKRYSTGKLSDSGELLCYRDGSTKWSSDGPCICWRRWRRPTEEELK